MIYRSSPSTGRRGIAALELAAVLPLILALIFGIWDVGRLVEVQQLTSNAARDGARLAAVGTMLDPTTGSEKDIYASDVQQTVLGYLTRNGISTQGATVQFTNLDNAAATDPYEAQNLQRLQVTVQVPFNNVRFILLNNFVNVNYTAITGTSEWLSMKDIGVTVPTTLPTN